MDPRELGQIVRAAREAKGLSQAQLGRLIGVKQQSLDAIERGETQRSKFLPEIAKELEIPPQSIGLPAEASHPPGTAPVGSPYAARDFPIYSAAEGGPGEIIRSPDAVDWWPRPIEVQHVKGAYGMYIVGESMIPEFEAGQIAVVNPNLPHIGGKSYIFYAQDEAGQARATVKRLRRATGDAWQVTQHNPPPGQKPDFSLPKKTWAMAHRIVGRQDPS
ncbi:helix-turn-helix domain-containing protein [Rhodopseudomonas sp. RCAM05734]|uniref:helix-turn-helix domain-containing protein n=1 Tax=Rhodopseudomonas sp. RCAM05734 TaxID=3457549 RepID=UPI0040443372